LGFIGAPLATAISFNLVSVMSIIYGIFFVDRTAWYPLSRRMFTSLGVLVQLGLSGVGEPIGLIGQFDSLIQLPRSNGIGVVGMGVDWARRVFVSVHGLSQFPD
jgi:hypothetical protein